MGKAADNWRQDNRDYPHRCGSQTGPGGGITIHLLQQLRQQHDSTEVEHVGETDAQTANGEVSRFKEREVDDRVVVGQLPDDQETDGDHRDDCQHDNLVGGEPVQLFTAVKHHLQAADTDHQQRQADAVNPPLFGTGFATAQGLQRHHHHRDANRYVDEEDPAPVVVVADIAAENRAANRRDDHRHRPQRQRDRTFGGRIVAEQQTLRQRNQRTGDDPLNHAEENQHRQAVGHPAGPGGDGKRHRRPQEQLHFPDAFCQPAGDRYRDSIRHPEGGDNPGPLAQR